MTEPAWYLGSIVGRWASSDLELLVAFHSGRVHLRFEMEALVDEFKRFDTTSREGTVATRDLVDALEYAMGGAA